MFHSVIERTHKSKCISESKCSVIAQLAEAYTPNPTESTLIQRRLSLKYSGFSTDLSGKPVNFMLNKISVDKEANTCRFFFNRL